MGMFSANRQAKNGATATDMFSLNPSTPPQTPASETRYMATMETPPSSSKLSIRSPTPVPNCPLPPLHTNQPTINVSMSTTASRVIRPTASKTSLNPRDARAASAFDLSSRFHLTPPLPEIWTPKHDHAICVLDSLNYSLSAIIKKLRSAFPELEGMTVTPVMVDKRLRCLDQNPEIEYFRTGIDFEKDEKETKGKGKEKMGRGWDMRIPPDPRVSTLTQQVDESEASVSALVSEDEEDRRGKHGSESEVFTLGRSDTEGKESVVRSERFETGFLSYRTTVEDEYTKKM